MVEIVNFMLYVFYNNKTWGENGKVGNTKPKGKNVSAIIAVHTDLKTKDLEIVFLILSSNLLCITIVVI